MIIHGELEGVVGLNGADWALINLDIGKITALTAGEVRGCSLGERRSLVHCLPTLMAHPTALEAVSCGHQLVQPSHPQLPLTRP